VCSWLLLIVEVTNKRKKVRAIRTLFAQRATMEYKSGEVKNIPRKEVI